ncbi:MAG: tRNA pseudouridine(55) synthase TruB [Chloroflexi bacterium]|nr:tRNA pseudouridine(55) synthase TruB [Chloroflexota bacterium]
MAESHVALRQAQGADTDGFLNIDKDPGVTSTGVVRRVKRLTRQRKVGHGGTLDPDATGVLAICIGKATRFVDAVITAGKTYVMTVRLGVATDTYDASGTVTLECDPSAIKMDQVEAALGRFRGEIEQVPPMFSALKREGRPLYELARSGVTVERVPRRVTVDRIELIEWRPPEFVVTVECERGFYARSLAHDIGAALDNAAHLTVLQRRRAGPFRIEDSITLAQLEEMVKLGNWQSAMKPPDFVLQELPAVVLDPLSEEHFLHGQPVTVTGEMARTGAHGQAVRAYSREGRFLALARYDSAGPWWRPAKVIAEA